MPNKPIIQDAKRYENEYVALRNFNDNEVIAHGENASKVISESIKLGVTEPVIIYVGCAQDYCYNGDEKLNTKEIK